MKIVFLTLLATSTIFAGQYAPTFESKAKTLKKNIQIKEKPLSASGKELIKCLDNVKSMDDYYCKYVWRVGKNNAISKPAYISRKANKNNKLLD